MNFQPAHDIIDNISRVVVGKKEVLELLMVALLAEGHILLEDVPGLGKTLITKSLARSIAATFRRIQFTPDLLPADVTGFNVYDRGSQSFTFQPGPVHTHILKINARFTSLPANALSQEECLSIGPQLHDCAQ